MVGDGKRSPGSVQVCRSCGKVYDIVCKRAYAHACETENECGCVDSDFDPENECDISSNVSLSFFSDSFCKFLC